MNELDLVVYGATCEKVAGLIRQRLAGEQVAFLLDAALAEQGVRFHLARATVQADPLSRVKQAPNDDAPKAALLAGLAHELQPHRSKKARAAEEEVERVLPQLRRVAEKLVKTAEEMAALLRDEPAAEKAPTNGHARPTTIVPPPREPRAARVEAPIPAGDDGLPDSALKVLRAVATFYPGHITVQQAATAAGYSHKSSSFKRDWSLLRRESYIQEMGAGQSGRFRATQGGCMRLGMSWKRIPKDTAGRVAFWKERLVRNEARILDAVGDHAGEHGLTMSQLADAVSLSATSSAFKAHVSNLKANGLVAKRGDHLVLGEAAKAEAAHA